MNDTEMLKLVVQSMKDKFAFLVRLAENPNWFNFDHPDVKNHLAAIESDLRKCLRLKNDFDDLKKLAATQ